MVIFKFNILPLLNLLLFDNFIKGSRIIPFSMWIYNLLIYVENDFVLDNFVFLFERLLNTVFLHFFILYYFSINLIKMVKIKLKAV